MPATAQTQSQAQVQGGEATPIYSAPNYWPFVHVSQQRLQALQRRLGGRNPDAMRDIDAHMDVVVTKWENEARRVA